MRRRGSARLVPGLWTQSAALAGEQADASDLVRRLRPAGTHPVERGDILVFGPGLGAGTTTDAAALALASAAVGGIVAASVDAAFRDACLHAGVPILTASGLGLAVADGDDLTVDFAAGTIENATRRRMVVAAPLSPAELRLARVAPSLAWYGLSPGPADPDVVETLTVPPNDY